MGLFKCIVKRKKKSIVMKDFELLKSLYKIYAPSLGEKKLKKFVRRAATERGGTCVTDAKGNIYVTKGDATTYPCICAHLDQVQRKHSKDFEVFMSGDVVFAYSAKSMEQQGLGADDKNGIWIALELLEQLDVLKCAFFVGEEIGCVGSQMADMEFFKDVRYCIQPDRRNGGDLITNICCDICSQDFLDAIDYKDFGYKPTSGLMTDVETLCEKGVGVSCINISCGYYNPHTDEECTRWSELCNALDFAMHICKKLVDTYPHEYTHEYPKYYGGYNWKGYVYYGNKSLDSYSDYDDWYESYHKESGKVEVEDGDKDLMREIIEGEPHLTFVEVLRYYGSLFDTNDKEVLRAYYNDEYGKVTHAIFEKAKNNCVDAV